MAVRTRSGEGFSLWREIAEELQVDIASGSVPVGGRLASEAALAARFGVNRHTVRQALAALAEAGIVHTVRGSGSRVIARAPLVHRIGARTRLGESLRGTVSELAVEVLDESVEPEPPRIVLDRLERTEGPLRRLDLVRRGDGRPLTMSTHWFPQERVPELAASLVATGSITASLLAAGIADYTRASTVIAARHATSQELAALDLRAGEIVLVTRSVDRLVDGAPLQYVETRFAASRIELAIDPEREGRDDGLPGASGT